MASRQVKIFCGILDWLERDYPEHYKVFKGLCLGRLLTAHKRSSGVTLILPTDKAVLTQLLDGLYTDNLEKAVATANLLRAHIIRDDLNSKQSNPSARLGDIPNSLSPPQHVTITSIKDGVITAPWGTATLANVQFRPGTHISVFILPKGHIPVTTDQPARMIYTKKNVRGAYSGGYQPTREHMASVRNGIAIAIENAYALDRASNSQRDTFIESTLSFVHYLYSSGNIAILRTLVLPLISYSKVDLYFWLEPHKCATSDSEYLVPTELITSWWSARKTMVFSNADVFACIQNILADGDDAAIYSQRTKLCAALDHLRTHVSKTIGTNIRTGYAEIVKPYLALESTNTIAGISNIFPDPLAKYNAANPGLMLARDQLRYITCQQFRQLESNPWDVGLYNTILNMIGEMLYPNSLAEREANYKLVSKPAMQYVHAPGELLEEITSFTLSNFYLYVPMTYDECCAAKSSRNLRPNALKLWNSLLGEYQTHMRVFTATDSIRNTQVSEMIKTYFTNINPDSIPDDLRSLIKSKIDS